MVSKTPPVGKEATPLPASLSTWPSKEPSTTTTPSPSSGQHQLHSGSETQLRNMSQLAIVGNGSQGEVVITCYVKVVYIILFSNSRSGDDNYSLKCIGHIDENIVAPGGSRWGWQRGQTMHLRIPTIDSVWLTYYRGQDRTLNSHPNYYTVLISVYIPLIPMIMICSSTTCFL